MVDLGEIQRVEDLREIWPHEAQDFTPWLAENLDKLGDALGLDLELQSIEAAVGAFALDVLAYAPGSNRTVIIENQLEVTNHDHLGKLLTYAAGYDAYAVVWLTREFREEHRAALDWLNQRTGDDTQFFGVVVEAWRIDDSRPAPHFRMVAMPNDWQKRASSTGQVNRDDGRVTESGEGYRDFFQSLLDTLRDEHRFTTARRPISHQGRYQNWYGFASGFRGIIYRAAFPRNKASVELYIDFPDGEANARLLDRLKEREEQIEAALEASLEWDSRENRRFVSVAVTRGGTISDASETIEEVHDWMVRYLLAFKRVFTPHLQELVK
ncbi:MAG: DUF4268 domain-containing protein [Chloroflexota bacterium]|nr:DUF4268 domain-containing protein [Chloroflexota bacterium]MDE2958562.1 DUF4268 domain-containing protein [Chloroflexota bacterium]